MADTDPVAGLAVFEELDDPERATLAEHMQPCEVKQGQFLFREGDPDNGCYVLQSGVVEIRTQIAPDIEKTLVTLRGSGVLGELGLVTGGYRSASAQVVEDARFLQLGSDEFHHLYQEHSELAKKMLRRLAWVISDRLVGTTEMYRRAVEWGLHISGTTEMSFGQLLSQSQTVTVDLVSGQTCSGMILRTERSGDTFDFLLRQDDGNLMVIPYAAVTRIAVGLAPALKPED